jgi:hypothetical protein
MWCCTTAPPQPTTCGTMMAGESRHGCLLGHRYNVLQKLHAVHVMMLHGWHSLCVGIPAGSVLICAQVSVVGTRQCTARASKGDVHLDVVPCHWYASMEEENSVRMSAPQPAACLCSKWPAASMPTASLPVAWAVGPMARVPAASTMRAPMTRNGARPGLSGRRRCAWEGGGHGNKRG